MKRISKDEYYLRVALAVAQRSTCLRSCYGAVIVKDNRILGTGYNGSASGEINCTDIEKCAREGIETRTRYELCKALHAEDNAIGNAESSVDGATIYIAGLDSRMFYFANAVIEKQGVGVLPCRMCYRRMVQRRIAFVCTRDEDGVPETIPLQRLAFLDQSNELPMRSVETPEDDRIQCDGECSCTSK